MWDGWSKRAIKTPVIIGHEYMDILEEAESGMRNLEPGVIS